MVQRYSRNPEPDVWQARERELKLSYALLRDHVADLELMLSSGVALRLEVPLVSAGVCVCVHLCASERACVCVLPICQKMRVPGKLAFGDV
jgi:hypothetical protein